MTVTHWSRSGLCTDKPPEVFHPTNNAYAEARSICEQCIVRPICLVTALDTEASDPKGGRHGMYGGYGPRERGRIQTWLTDHGWSTELVYQLVDMPLPTPVEPNPALPRPSGDGS